MIPLWTDLPQASNLLNVAAKKDVQDDVDF